MSNPRGHYHHGNAKQALLAAANELLESEGAAGLSLRQVAERARLSRQAPYNHFADKETLLADLARVGFERLATAVSEAGSSADGNPLARVAGTYIEFAQTTSALFRLMFSRELVDLAKFPAATAAAAAAFANLAAVVAKFAAPERIPELSLAAWSLVHGYSMLCIEANFEPSGRRVERARLFARIIQGEASRSRI
ncbi:MAG: TetR-like C-terminal domain-containing protein [Steroidobacteraceae bacterium]